MRQDVLRNAVGAIIVLGHLGLLVVVVAYVSRALEPEQQTRVLLSLGPVAATYFVAVIKTSIRERYNPPNKIRVRRDFAVYAIAVVTFFMSALYYFCLRFPSGLTADGESLSQWISGTEVALGGTLGLIVDALFPGPAEYRGTVV